MDLKQAQEEAKDVVRQLRYGPENKDYFWINDMHPTGIMHPYLPELEGRDLTQYVDHYGNHPFVDFAEMVRRNGAGFVEYSWQWKDNPLLTAPKLSYVRGFAPWGWVIGTGIYIRDVEAEMAGMTRNLTLVSLGILVMVSFLSGFLVLGSIRAARQRKEAHLALRRQGEEYRAVFEAAPDPMVVYDNQGRATYLNPAFTRLFGWTWEEVIGRRLDFVPEENQEETRGGDQGSHGGRGGLRTPGIQASDQGRPGSGRDHQRRRDPGPERKPQGHGGQPQGHHREEEGRTGPGGVGAALPGTDRQRHRRDLHPRPGGAHPVRQPERDPDHRSRARGDDRPHLCRVHAAPQAKGLFRQVPPPDALGGPLRGDISLPGQGRPGTPRGVPQRSRPGGEPAAPRQRVRPGGYRAGTGQAEGPPPGGEPPPRPEDGGGGDPGRGAWPTISTTSSRSSAAMSS